MKLDKLKEEFYKKFPYLGLLKEPDTMDERWETCGEDVYSWHISEMVKLLERVEKEVENIIDNYGGFEDDGGNLCHYDDELKKDISQSLSKLKEEVGK